jgi:hypothetical protein
MIEALSPQQQATVNKRCLRDFTWPAAMRRIVTDEFGFEQTDEQLLGRIKEAFPEPWPSIRTVQDWRYAARREWDEQRLEVVSQVLWKSAHKAVPKAVASLYGALTNAYALMEEATRDGDVKTRLRAQSNVGDLGEKLLNQFRGGPAEGASPIELGSVREKAILKMLESGTFASREQAEATFSAWVEGTAAVVEEQALGEQDNG